MTDLDIIKYCFDNKGRINSSIYRFINTKKEYHGIGEYLKNRYSDIPSHLFSYKEVLWRIHYNINVRPVCEICGNPVEFCKKPKKSKMFQQTCCFKCQRILAKRNTENTNIKKYGVKSNLQIEEIINKSVQARCSESAKQKKYETMKSRYGCLYAFHTEKGKENAKISSILYREKRSKKYKEVSELIKSGINPETYYDTSVEYDEAITLYNNMIKIIDKTFKTAKQNNHLKGSLQEDNLFKILCSNFNIVLRNYKDERYNYRCDFYIPELDLFIEYQGSFYHNKHPFDKTNFNDIKILKDMKEKSETRKLFNGGKKTRYDSLINTWTIRDIEKRDIAVKNNINYLEIFPKYNFNDLPQFIKNNYNIDKHIQLIIGTNN